MPKIIIFAGAPRAESLSWDIPLHDTFLSPISAFVDLNDGSSTTRQETQSQPHYPQWRYISLDKQEHLRADHTQQPDYFLRSTDLVSFTSISGVGSALAVSQASETEDDLRSQFYDHSLALHEASHLDDRSFTTTSSSQDQSSDPIQYSPAPSLDPIGTTYPLVNLSSLPPPAKLAAPKSPPPIISVLAGILAASSHTVATRFGPRPIVELLVGDETRSAGLPLTFWLPPARPDQTLLGRSLRGLRRGDVVLVHGVRLGVFRERVFGQSVRGAEGYGTRVHLMYRGTDPCSGAVEEMAGGNGERRGHYSLKDLAVQGAVHPQLEKTRRVRMWVLEFMGVGKKLEGWDVPPQDTQ